MAFVLLPSDLPTWPTIQRHLRSLSGTSSASQVTQIIYALHSLCNVSLDPETPEVLPPDLFKGLEKFLKEEGGDDFFSSILPFMVESALNLKTLLPPEGLIYSIQQEDAERILQRPLVASLLSHIFFCTLPRRTQLSHPTLTDPRLAPVLSSLHKESQRIKVQALLQYFRVLALHSTVGSITLSRKVMTAQMFLPMGSWSSCDVELCPIQVIKDSSLQLHCGSSLLSCFTSPDLARPALTTDCSQQVSTMISYPELLVASVIAERLEDNEALQVNGVLHTAAVSDLATTKPMYTPLMNLAPPELVHVLMDADDYRESYILQYEKINVLRELNKAWVGFGQPPPEICFTNRDPSEEIISISRQHSSEHSMCRLSEKVSSDSDYVPEIANESTTENNSKTQQRKSQQSNDDENQCSNVKDVQDEPVEKNNCNANKSMQSPLVDSSKEIREKFSVLKKESSKTESEKDLPFHAVLSKNNKIRNIDSKSKNNILEIDKSDVAENCVNNSIPNAIPCKEKPESVIAPKTSLMGLVSSLKKSPKPNPKDILSNEVSIETPERNLNKQLNIKYAKEIVTENNTLSNESFLQDSKNFQNMSIKDNLDVRNKTNDSGSTEGIINESEQQQIITGTNVTDSNIKITIQSSNEESSKIAEKEDKHLNNKNNLLDLNCDTSDSNSVQSNHIKPVAVGLATEIKCLLSSEKHNCTNKNNLAHKLKGSNETKTDSINSVSEILRSTSDNNSISIPDNDEIVDDSKSCLQSKMYCAAWASGEHDKINTICSKKCCNCGKQRQGSFNSCKDEIVTEKSNCEEVFHAECNCKQDCAYNCDTKENICDILPDNNNKDSTKEINSVCKPLILDTHSTDNENSNCKCRNNKDNSPDNKIQNSSKPESIDKECKDKTNEKMKMRVNTLENPVTKSKLEEDDETTKLLNRILKAIEKLELERPELVKRKHSFDQTVKTKNSINSEEIKCSNKDVQIQTTDDLYTSWQQQQSININEVECKKEVKLAETSVRPKTKSKPPLPETKKSSSFLTVETRHPSNLKRISIRKKSSDHLSVESKAEDDIYYSACESIDGQEDVQRKSTHKDKGRRKSFAERLKETLARGTSNDNSLSRPITPEEAMQQARLPDSPTCVIVHRQAISGESSGDPIGPSSEGHYSKDTHESEEPEDDKDSDSSRYSFSSDYSSDMEGVYDQLEEILDDVEAREQGPRSAAVARFAHAVLKRALSDTYKGLSVGLDGIVVHNEPTSVPAAVGHQHKTSEDKLFPRPSRPVRSHTFTESSYKKKNKSTGSALNRLLPLDQISAIKPCQISISYLQDSYLKPVVTGNWGCGSLKGDPELKAMIQWAAASRAGAPLVTYYTAGDARLVKLDLICRMISDRHWTVGQLVTSLMTHCQARIQEWQQNEARKTADVSLPESYRYRVPSLDEFTLFDELMGTVARSTQVLRTEL